MASNQIALFCYRNNSNNVAILLPLRVLMAKKSCYCWTFSRAKLFPLGKISVSIAIRIEIQRKAFANMLMFCVRISSTWLSQYQNSIIDCGEIQLKTSYFSFLIFAFSSIIRNRSKSLSYRRSCTKRYFSYSVSA